MSDANQHSLSATAGGLIACLIWGSSIAIMGMLAKPLGPLSACGYECLIAGVILLAFSAWRGRLRNLFMHSPAYYLFCGGFWMANFSLAWIAVSMVTDSEQLVVVGMFNYLWPILTLLGSVVILGKRAGLLIVPGVLITAAGLVLSKAVQLDLPLVDALMRLLRLFDDNPAAYLVATLDALAWALYSNLGRKLAHPQGASAVPIFMLVTAVVLIIAGKMQGEIPLWTVQTFSLLSIWAIASAFAYLAWDIGMREGDIVLISSASMLIPLLSTVITCLMNGIPLTIGLISASLCIVLGAAVCKRAVRD